MDTLATSLQPPQPQSVPRETHPLISLITASFSVIFWLLTWVKATIGFVTISVPRLIYAILSYSFTLTLNFYTLAALFLIGSISLSFYIRFRYLSSYSELKELPLDKPSAQELHPDIVLGNSSEDASSFNNYLDEFLQAIRVFGFLEKPVFHELARHLQTRRLIAGDCISLDMEEDKNFYCVVDGKVQVFAPPNENLATLADDDGVEGMNGFQLLNEVGSGGTVSSLFTILSLFTEDVQLRWTEEDPEDDISSFFPEASTTSSRSSRSRTTSVTGSYLSADSTPSVRPTVDLLPPVNIEHRRASPPGFGKRSMSTSSTHSVVSSTGSTVHAPPSPDAPSQDWTPSTPPNVGPSVSHPATPRMSLKPGHASNHSVDYFSSRSASRPTMSKTRSSRHPKLEPPQGTIARAAVDTTLAVIPAEAFARLTKKFPKASAHIVQVILTRFSRVTFQTAHKYLGLTAELLRTEKSINDIASHPLPRGFYEGGGVERLRGRFKEASSDEDTEDDPHSDYFDRSKNNARRLASELSQTAVSETQTSVTAITQQISEGKTTSISNSTPITPFRPASRSVVNAGDLLTSTGADANLHSAHHHPLSRKWSGLGRKSPAFTPSGRKPVKGVGEDFDLRDEVMSSIAKSIGLMQPMSNTQLVESDIDQDTIPVSSSPNANATGSFAAKLRLARSTGRPAGESMFNASFSSLLDDQESSMTGGSSSVGGAKTDADYLSGLDNEVEILCFKAGSLLVRAGEKNAGLFYVIDGLLDVYMPLEESLNETPLSQQTPHPPKPASAFVPSTSSKRKKGRESYRPSPPRARAIETEAIHHKLQAEQRKTAKHLFTVKPGGIAGYFASLSGIPSYVDIRAKTDVYVGFLPTNSLERLLEKRPIVLLTLAKRLISLLPPLIIHIDSALDWTQVASGQVLWRQGDPSDSFYIVINGRLRALIEHDHESSPSGSARSDTKRKSSAGEITVVGEFGQGDTVGELDVITNSPRQNVVHAIRDTELARIPMTLFNAVSMRHPQTSVHLLKKLAKTVRAEAESNVHLRRADEVPSGVFSHSPISSRYPGIGAGGGGLGPNNMNLKTVAVLPSTKSIPIDEFAKKLQTALEETVGVPTSFLNQGAVMRHLGRHAFSRMGKLKVGTWLADLEQRYRIVLYVADSPVSSPWTQTCIRQADCIMVVGKGDDPSVGEFERMLISAKTTARKMLVLLHPSRSIIPGTTREWLKQRPWVHAHFHVELPGLEVSKPIPVLHDPAAVVALKNLKDKVQSELKKYRNPTSTPRPQVQAHNNDFARLARYLVGKSVGLVLGGGGARGIAQLGFIRALEENAIPIDHLGGCSIGALIGGLYAEEADILSSSAKAKQFGGRMSSVWRMLSDLTWPVVAYTTGHEFNRSIYKTFYDTHIEDMWLPFFCNTTNILDSRMEIHESGYAWRYIRASMTLVGLLPPLSDNGRVLVDGGYVDNLPVSTMIRLGANIVFAVDVGSLDDNSPRHFGDTVSGSWTVLNKWNPFSRARSVPHITEIQSRLAYVSSVRTLEEAKVTPGCLYMAMPVQEYGTLQFGKFDEIVEKGYNAAVEMLRQWSIEGKLPLISEESGERARRKGRGLRRNSI